MKISITLLSNFQTINLEINENERIKSLCEMINCHLNIDLSNIDYRFIYRRSFCDDEKTMKELNVEENSPIYAIKKNKTKVSLKRDSLDSLMNQGCEPKKRCVMKEENQCDYQSWINRDLASVQSELGDAFLSDPSLIRAIFERPQIQTLIDNPGIVTALYSTDPRIASLITNQSDKVKWFTDVSQYDWMKNIAKNVDQIDRLSMISNYNENLKSIIGSKRYEKMRECLWQCAGAEDEDNEAEEAEEDEELGEDRDAAQRLTERFAKQLDRQYATMAPEMLRAALAAMTRDPELAIDALQCCPLAADTSAERQWQRSLLPRALALIDQALVATVPDRSPVPVTDAPVPPQSQELAPLDQALTANDDRAPADATVPNDNDTDADIGPDQPANGDRNKTDHDQFYQSIVRFMRDHPIEVSMATSDFDTAEQPDPREEGTDRSIDRLMRQIFATVQSEKRPINTDNDNDNSNRYERELRLLAEMGFKDGDAGDCLRAALDRDNGDVSRLVCRLLSQSA